MLDRASGHIQEKKMQCPKCDLPLKGIDYQGIHIETCPSCGGDWLDAGELGSIVRARNTRFDEKECIAIAQATKITGVKLSTLNRHLTCPKCAGTTQPVNYGDDTGLIIDKCAQCGGVWLERGEIEKIQELVEGWRDELPGDLAEYGPKLRQVAADVDRDEKVHIAHIPLMNALINGILDFAGE
jgi:Zn-finger nucleic acid-binding protein